jgi:DNA-directed RNA polymerase specialized sigma24 family protein
VNRRAVISVSQGNRAADAREGWEAAFEEIVLRYGGPLTRYAASIVGGRSEDVTQDAFSKALRCDDAEIELRPWLFPSSATRAGRRRGRG